MKKYYLILVAVFTAFMLTACGMSSEEIATYMTSLETSYQNGTYEQAQSEVKKLEKSTKNMTEEQKTKFDELKLSVEYAVASLSAINKGLDNAQSNLDQKMYYEAVQELDKITATYTMPPAEQKKYDEKKAAADKGIKSVKAGEVMQKAESALSSGDYNAASSELGNVDTSALTEEQNQKYQSLQTQITEAKAKAEAEAEAKAKAEAEKKARENSPETKAKAVVRSHYSGWSVKSAESIGGSSYYVYITDGERNKRITVSDGMVMEDLEMPNNAMMDEDSYR